MRENMQVCVLAQVCGEADDFGLRLRDGGERATKPGGLVR